MNAEGPNHPSQDCGQLKFSKSCTRMEEGEGGGIMKSRRGEGKGGGGNV